MSALKPENLLGPLNVVNNYGPFSIVNNDFCHSCVLITLANCTKQYSKRGRHLFSCRKQILFVFFLLLLFLSLFDGLCSITEFYVLCCKYSLFYSIAGALPEEFGNLKKLETLSLENNVLTSLPASVKNLSHLRTLNLTGNGFRAFPDILSDLKSLDAVDLSRNKITQIPAATRTCQVIELNLNQNQVSQSDSGGSIRIIRWVSQNQVGQ